MTLLLGRCFGFVAILIFAPVMGLLGLMLKLAGAPRAMRAQIWLGDAQCVRTTRFVTPANAFGQFLRENYLDHLPALLDIAAGRVRLLVECKDRVGIRIAFAPAPRLDQAPRARPAQAGIVAPRE